MTMNSTILDELHSVEGTGVEILLAVESGSRAWGFASKDSDYDVRFVYMRPVREYLRLDKGRDVIDWRLDDDLDIVGWDVFKFLGLLVKSNPTAFEWMGSKIIYKEDKRFQSVRNAAPRCFDPKKSAYHYLGMAKKHDFRYIEAENATLKRYLYTVRALLASRWSLVTLTPAPMPFDTLKEAFLDKEMTPLVDDVLERKKNGSESGRCERIEALDAWIVSQIADLERKLADFQYKGGDERENINHVFQNLVL